MRARAIPFYSQRECFSAFCVPTIRWDFMFICLHSITTLCSLADNQHCCPRCTVPPAAVVVVHFVGLGAAPSAGAKMQITSGMKQMND